MKISVDEVRAVIALHSASVMAGIKYLSDYLEGMDYSKVFELEVLMDFGREWYEGAIGTEQAADISLLDCYHAYEKYADNPDGKASAINYLVGKSLLSEYLRSALAHCDPTHVLLPDQKHVHSPEKAKQYTTIPAASEASTQFDKLMQAINQRIHPIELSASDRLYIKDLLRKFPFELLMECVDISAEKYLQWSEDRKTAAESVTNFLHKIGGIAYNKSADPVDQAINHLVNTMKKNFAYWNDRTARIIIRDYVKALRSHGWDETRIHVNLSSKCREAIKNSRNWSQWRETMERWTKEIATKPTANM